jgi:hypothetical protein
MSRGKSNCLRPCENSAFYRAHGNLTSRRRGKLPAAPARPCYAPAPPSVVTARRFCDQHEMSSHTATGRSLP